MPSACHKTVWSRAILIRNRSAIGTRLYLLEHRRRESTARQRLSTRKNGQPWKIKVSFRNMFKRTLAMACRDSSSSVRCFAVTLALAHWHGSNCVSDGKSSGVLLWLLAQLKRYSTKTQVRRTAVVKREAARLCVLCTVCVIMCVNTVYQHCFRLSEDWKRLNWDSKSCISRDYSQRFRFASDRWSLGWHFQRFPTSARLSPNNEHQSAVVACLTALTRESYLSSGWKKRKLFLLVNFSQTVQLNGNCSATNSIHLQSVHLRRVPFQTIRLQTVRPKNSRSKLQPNG